MGIKEDKEIMEREIRAGVSAPIRRFYALHGLCPTSVKMDVRLGSREELGDAPDAPWRPYAASVLCEIIF
jgi:hypothetical protein